MKFAWNLNLIQLEGNSGESELLLAIVAGQQTHLARFVINRELVEVQLFDRDKKVTDVARCRIDSESTTCAVANIDSQIIVAVGEQQALLLDLISQRTAAPVELLASIQPSNSEDLKRLRLWRDIYYFSPLSRDELLKRQAGTGLAGTEGYFVVGDNLPISWDSRRWLQTRESMLKTFWESLT